MSLVKSGEPIVAVDIAKASRSLVETSGALVIDRPVTLEALESFLAARFTRYVEKGLGMPAVPTTRIELRRLTALNVHEEVLVWERIADKPDPDDVELAQLARTFADVGRQHCAQVGREGAYDIVALNGKQELAVFKMKLYPVKVVAPGYKSFEENGEEVVANRVKEPTP